MADTPSQHHGGVAAFYQDAPHFQVEAFHPHGANITRFQLASGGIRWFIVGCYINPKNAPAIDCIVTDIGQRPHRDALMVVGYFNANWRRWRGTYVGRILRQKA